MKLINCPKCNDVVNLMVGTTRVCDCGNVGGKYLDDHITAVVNKDALVVGIDNNGFNIARHLAIENKDFPRRIDYFFTGWIPTKPGEVIVVDTVENVLRYNFFLKEEDKNYDSTSPTEF